MDTKHLGQKQLAARWSLSEASLERWRSEGIGPMFLKLPGRVLYRQVDIEAFEESACQRRQRPWLIRLGSTENVAFSRQIQHTAPCLASSDDSDVMKPSAQFIHHIGQRDRIKLVLFKKCLPLSYAIRAQNH